MTVSLNLHNILLSGYILCFIFLNIITSLIASFYRKKFNQKSMRLGFGFTILVLFLYIPCLFIVTPYQDLCRNAQTLLLITGSIASVWNSTTLFLTMKRVRK